ncbi:probable ATP-dependent RNA helicase spindle-E [Pieris brassicae]|uniref:probable ATP-dependent RNA helicase spindle-E n=1 Tax=Pieris brassicae TaxID=7116 RepID=UPI001E661CAC|nr:probable ATP-dependent RNA helicase spindle-E [Pieris brassicae]XP_045519373.1 probable ATP-dependent RNA helicase spindle-E [Pieris brassicae]
MDEVRSFFTNPTVQCRKLRGPITAGCRVTKNDSIYGFNRPEEHRQCNLPTGTDYAGEVQQRELELYLKCKLAENMSQDSQDGLNSLENLTSWGSVMSSTNGNLADDAMAANYSNYNFTIKEDTKDLAINKYKEEIMSRITAYPIVIIEGQTGCGKTTQVPQWILHDAYERRMPCKIVVTQPRRIAATSIAKRVAQERGWDVGGLVGYQVALENITSTDTRISYVTTGVLLQKLVSSKNLNEYTHIILDEVHERGQEMDFLLLVVKKLMYTVSSGVRVILMSATFNTKVFTNYFHIPAIGDHNKPSCIHIKTGQAKQKVFYINNLNKFTLPTMNDTPQITMEMHHLVVKLVNGFESIDSQGHSIDISNDNLPSVLIFLPGIHEIEELYTCLTNDELRRKLCGQSSLHWWVLPLHSTITADEQVRVFQRAPPGQRKIILSTNIAESSITVPDIKYVIDYCLMKVLIADVNINFTTLQLQWASKANCDQRAGRAGRVGGGGRVYRLVTDKFYENFLDECTPELTRCPLERLVLLAKTLEMGPPVDILALAMNPPDLSNVHRTILVLKEVGALKKLVNGEWSSSDGDITYLGRIMAQLPLNVQMSKLIMLGYIFGCLDECVIMAAAMSVKNVFSSPFREQLNAYNSKLTWADGSTSDSIAFLNVYKVWSHLRQQHHFKKSGESESKWARRFYVQVRAMRELDEMVRELRMRLSREEIDTKMAKSHWGRQELPVVLKVLLAGAFYPQYFVQVAGDEVREREAVRTLSGLNPRNTVYLKGFPDNQPGDIYATAIKKVIMNHIGDEPRVTFDKNSRKVFLTFNDKYHEMKRNQARGGDPTIPGQVVLPIYKSIKARQLKMQCRIPLLPLNKANDLAKAMEALKISRNVDQMVPRLPEVDDTHFPLTISQLINVGKFWVQYADESTACELRLIQQKLNRKPLTPCSGSPAIDMLVAAPYLDASGTKMYRARISRLLSKDMLEVFFIDYGSVASVSLDSLRLLPDGMDSPPLAMLCVLAEIAPAPLLSAHSEWPPGSLLVLTDFISKGGLIGKVYSVTHGVVSIELMAEGGRISFNKELITNGLAVKCEESYESKLNHDLRETASELNMSQKRAHNKEQSEMAYKHVEELGPSSYKECISDVCLNGPFSPLETKVHNLMYASHDKPVNIESSSVNSVLLDTDPQEIYERLLVAAEVGQNEVGSRLTLRHTTLMPNIPGLPALLALIFCPEAELRRDSSSSRYVSVLCGLGSDAEGHPYFPEHDLLVNIDADLTVDDIGTINHLRYLMDLTMHMRNKMETPIDDVDFATNLPQLIREDLMKLLLKRRKHRYPESVLRAWEWKSIPDEEFLSINVPDMVERAEVYPLHAPLELTPLSRERLLELKRDNDALKMLVNRASLTTNTDLSCKLCGTAPMAVHAMRIHLFSNVHREKEDDFNIVNS